MIWNACNDDLMISKQFLGLSQSCRREVQSSNGFYATLSHPGHFAVKAVNV